LRARLPQWLSLPEFRSLVVGFEEAHIGHGGEARCMSGPPSAILAAQNGRTIPTRG